MGQAREIRWRVRVLIDLVASVTVMVLGWVATLGYGRPADAEPGLWSGLGVALFAVALFVFVKTIREARRGPPPPVKRME